jgi:hypothetical protein
MYIPRSVPSDAAMLPQFLDVELAAIAREWGSAFSFLRLETLYAAPARLYEGLLVKADGVTWNPGGGPGLYAYISGAWVGPLGAGGGGGTTRSVSTVVDFGSGFTDKAQAVVTGQAWVTAATEFSTLVLTPTSADPDEMYLLDMRAEISSIVPGTGYTVTVYSAAEATGQYTVTVIGN